MSKITLILFTVVLLTALSLVSSQHSIPNLPRSVREDLASREMRYHHYIFHNVRGSWNVYSSSTKAQLRSLGWEPPRPSKTSSGKGIYDNNAGEDFLYMHHQMINMVNRILADRGYGPVTGFRTIPSRSDSTYPMPPSYTGPTSATTNLIRYYKTDDFYRHLKDQERRLTDPEFLRSVTLGELGAIIEFSSDVHQGMHFRLSSFNRLMRVKSSAALPLIDPKWDVLSSDWLADIYASHVNPWFWKLHGWINDRIEDWRIANGLDEISWEGTWVGGDTLDLPSNLNIVDNLDITSDFGPLPSGSNLRVGEDDMIELANVGAAPPGFTGDEQFDMGGFDPLFGVNPFDNQEYQAGEDAPFPGPENRLLKDNELCDDKEEKAGSMDVDMDMDMGISKGGEKSQRLKNLEAVVKILIESGHACDFYNELAISKELSDAEDQEN